METALSSNMAGLNLEKTENTEPENKLITNSSMSRREELRKTIKNIRNFVKAVI
jgi:hypothetical protein